MSNRKFQCELGKCKVDTVSIRDNPHKAFVERLKKQISTEECSSSTGDADSSDDDVCSKELMKELEAKFEELFADFDDD